MGASIINPTLETPYRNLDVDESADVASAAPVYVYRVLASNRNATTEHFLKLYDKATAADENDTPVFTLPLPAASNHEFDLTIAARGGHESEGVPFLNGVSLRAVAEVADNGTTGAGANEVVVHLLYRLP